MRRFIVLVGNNGTRKTFFSESKFHSKEIIVRIDDFKGDYDQIQKRFFSEIEIGLRNKNTVVLDGLNLEKNFRKQLLYFTNKYSDCEKIIYDFGPGNQKTLERLIKDRPFKSALEWERIFNENLEIYEKPTKEEGYKIVTVPSLS